MKKSHKKLYGILSVIFVLLVILFYLIVTQSGHWLVVDDEFKHVKWAVILDGQTADLERNDYVANLLQDGKVDSVMILGRRVFRDKSNADYYAEDFLKLGKFNSSTIFLARHDDPSTIAEAYTIIPWLELHKVDSVLLVTAAPATKRVKRIFTELSASEITYLTADVHHHQYYADSWIFNRESRKNWLHEWAALTNSYLDLFRVEKLHAADSTYNKRIRSIADEESDNPIVDLQQLIPVKQQPKDTLAADSVKTAVMDSVSAKPDSTKLEAAKSESAKLESAKKDSTKQESVKQESPKKESPKSESPKKDSAKSK